MKEWAADSDAWLTALADGEPVDWAIAEQTAQSPQQREFVRQLRLVARIAETYRDASPSSSSDSASVGVPIEVAEATPGTRWGTLEIVGVIGRGTFGDVYRARDTRLDRAVALKLLRTERHARRTEYSEVVNEGRLLARVRHPNVAAVFGADRIDGRVGVWMELIEGRTLEEELRERGALPPDEVARIGLELCRALAAVHDAGLLHRDIKTQNVMRDARDGRIVLMDLSAGRERMAPHAVEASMPLSLAGSPAYLAPEVLRGRPATPQSDIYSLGVLLFRLLTGAFPVSGSTLQEIGNAHVAGLRRRLRDVAPALPAPLSHIVEAAIHPNISNRPRSARDMEHVLAAVPEPHLPKREGRSRRWALACAAVALIGATGLTVATRFRHGTESLASAVAPSLVLLADVDNQTANTAMGRQFDGLLRAELSNGRVLSLVTRQQVDGLLALMRRPQGSGVDSRLARELIVRDGGIRALVVGRVRQTGESHEVTAELVNPADGAVLASEHAELTAAIDAPATVRRLARRLSVTARQLVPAMQLPVRRLEPVTTASLAALELYSRAASLLSGELTQPQLADFETAQTLLRQAVDADPAFASAWLLLARTTRSAHPHERLHWPALEQAERLAEGVGDSEGSLIRGFAYRTRGLESGSRADLEAGAREYEAFLAREGLPTDKIALPGTESPRHSVVPELESTYQELYRRDAAEALVLRASAAMPDSMRLAAKVARIELRRGNIAASRALAMRVQTASLSDLPDRNIADIAWARLWDAHAAWLNSDATAALAAIERANRQWADPGERQQTQWGWHVSKALEGLGRFDDAEPIVRRLGAQYVSGGVAFPSAQSLFRNLGTLEIRRGRLATARELFGQLNTFEELTQVSLGLVRAGMLDKADWLAVERRRRGTVPVWTLQSINEGALRVAQGRYREGLELLEPVISRMDFHGVSRWAREYAAIAHRALGDPGAAIRVLEPMADLRVEAVSEAWSVNDWLRCRVLLVELYRQTGRQAASAKVEAEVRKLLAVADAGNPLLARLDRP